MADVLRAMSISGGILLLIVGITVLVSFATVKRGEASMQVFTPAERVWWNRGPSPVAVGVDGTTATLGAKPATSADISVIEILLVGGGLFTLAVLGLLGLSILQHL